MPRRDSAAIDFRGTAPLLAALTLAAAAPASGASAPGASRPVSGNTGVTPFEVAAAPHPDTLARMAAMRYGAGEFHRVEAIGYTFKIRSKGKEVERRWIWFPRRDSVHYEGKDTAGLGISASYSRRNRFSMESPAVRAIDRWFINDQYWLLFPLHLVWDKGLRLSSASLPAARGNGVGEAWRLTATYPAEGGYTPGDAYDLFLDTAGMVRRWIFRKGNAPEPTREALWSAPVQAGPLRISMERKGPEGDFRLWFEDVRVELRSESDMPPRPAGLGG